MDILKGQDLIFLLCNLSINLFSNYTDLDYLHVHSNLKKTPVTLKLKKNQKSNSLQVPEQLPWKRQDQQQSMNKPSQCKCPFQ